MAQLSALQLAGCWCSKNGVRNGFAVGAARSKASTFKTRVPFPRPASRCGYREGRTRPGPWCRQRRGQQRSGSAREPSFPPHTDIEAAAHSVFYLLLLQLTSPQGRPRAVSHVRLFLHVAHSAYASPPGRQGTCERARGSPDFADVTGLSSATTDTAIACGHPNYRLPDRQEVPMVFLGRVK